MFERLEHAWQRWQFGRKQQSAFLEDLSVLVEDGVPVSQAVEIIRQVSQPGAQQVATQVALNIAQGRQLADGMQGWFPRPVIEIIRSGEISGTLSKTLRASVAVFSQRNGVLNTFISSMVYPLIVVTLAFILVVFIKHSVLESFSHIHPISQWPSVGRDLYYLGAITQRWWWLFVLLVVVGCYGVARMLQQSTGVFRLFIDRLPLLSLYRDMTAARFMETLGLLMANGVVLKKALSILHREASPYLSWHILNMEFRLSGGQDSIADVLDTQLIHPNDLVRLRVVSKSKGFEYALMRLGQQSSLRTTRAVVLSGKIAGGLILAMGAMMAATIIFGIYSVGSSIAG